MVVESCRDWTRREENKEAIVLQMFLMNNVEEKLFIRNGISDCSISVTTHGHVGIQVLNKSFG